jgi:hypothetical protein
MYNTLHLVNCSTTRFYEEPVVALGTNSDSSHYQYLCADKKDEIYSCLAVALFR